MNANDVTGFDTDAETRMVRVLGHDIRVSVRPGTDPGARPLLMLMGIGGNIEMWEPLRSALTERVGMTTVAFDVPGTGESPPPCFPLPLPLVGLLTRELLRSLDLDEVDVLGLSWGGLLAQQLALTAPKRVRRLVLASTSPGLGSVPGGWRVIRMLATPARYRSKGDLLDAMDAFGGDPGCVDAMRVHNAARLARPPSLRGYYGQIVGLLGWSSLPWLPLITQRTLVLLGGADPAIPVVNGRIMAGLLPHAELEVVPDAGHLLLFQRLDTSVELLATFLEPPTDPSRLQPCSSPATDKETR